MNQHELPPEYCTGHAPKDYCTRSGWAAPTWVITRLIRSVVQHSGLMRCPMHVMVWYGLPYKIMVCQTDMCYTQYVLHYVLHPVCVTLCVTPSMCYTMCYTQWYDIGCHAVPDGYVLHPGQSIFLMIHITALQSAAWEGRPHTYKYTNTSTNVYKYRYKYIAYTKI